MKHTLIWHKQCLANAQRSAEDLRSIITMQARRLATMDAENKFYDFQIWAAENCGKDGFDRDKWRVKKTKKGEEI